MKNMKKKIKNFNKIKSETGWNSLKIIKRLIKAHKYGINLNDYVKNKCYKKKKKEIIALGEKLKLKEEAIKEIVVNNKKISKKYAEELLEEAQKLGITYKRFVKDRMWEFTKDELKEYKEALDKLQEKNKKNKLWYAKVVMEKTNLEEQEAIERMDIARKKGYSYKKFITEDLYLLSRKELENLTEKENPTPSKEEEKILKEKQKEKQNQRLKAANEMGISIGRYRINYINARTNCGCNGDEYYLYKLYNKTKEEQRKFITEDNHFKMKIKYWVPREKYKYFKDKSLFNKTFKKWINRKWFLTENLTFEDFEKNIKGLNTIAYKPLDMQEGKGFKKFKVNENEIQNRNVYECITKSGPGLIEEFIIQHKETAKFHKESCNSIRIATIKIDGKVNILAAVFRTGVNNDYDNWSAGGIIAGINIKTGKIDTDGADKIGNIYKTHPISNIKFKGFQIPNWDKVIKTVIEAANKIEDVVYVGWDIAITKDNKIELIEGNHNHAMRIFQSIYGIAEEKGILNIIKPYIK